MRLKLDRQHVHSLWVATASMETYELLGELVDKGTLDVSYDVCKRGWMSTEMDEVEQESNEMDEVEQG